jgi:hypothetical protein
MTHMATSDIIDDYDDSPHYRFDYIRALARWIYCGHPLGEFRRRMGEVDQNTYNLAADCARFL